jgi:PAS domain S-box-containing protein
MNQRQPVPLGALCAQERHDLVVRNSGDYVMVMTDLDGLIVDWNPSAERVLGWTAQEAIGCYADLFFTPQDKQQHRARLEMDLAARDGLALDERWHIKRDGSFFWALGELMALRQDGVLIGYSKILRDRTQERLTAERLRLTQEVGGIGVFELFLQEAVLHVSPQFCQIWGLREEELQPIASLLEQVHPDDRHRLITAQTDLPAHALNYVEYRIRRADTGEERWLARKGERVHIEDLQTTRYIGLCYDITDRQRMKASLAESEARFRATIHSIEQMVWSTLPNGQHDFFNERWYAYTGTPVGNHDGVGWTETLYPADRERVLKAWDHCLATGDPYRVEYRLRRADGEFRWFLARAQAVRDAQGSISRWFGTSTDIQEIVTAREVLSMSHDDLMLEVAERTRERDRLWQLTHDLMTVTQVDGHILATNEACTQALGWDQAELVGSPILRLIHPDDLAQAEAEMERLKRGLDTTQIELRMRHRNGRYRLISWTAVSAAEQVYAVGRDITELRHTEDQLRQAQKMEAVGQLTGGIAHDFNNLLTGIIGSLDLMQRRHQAGQFDKLEKYMTAATTSAQRAAALTQRLLAFSRRQTLDMQPTDVNQRIASLEDLLRRTLSENIRLDTHLGSGLGLALTDANQLESALLNLIINARDALPHGGAISISTSAVRLPEPAGQELLDLAPGDYVRICVADTGTGMTDEVRARAFEPFFTTKPIGQGTGLGLSMIYGYVRQSRAGVEITSQVGLGTRVCLTLPRYAGELPGAGDAIPGAAGQGGGEVILVVEDEPVVRALIVEVLQELGYQILQAGDAQQALPLLQAERAIDLLVSDVGLPGINGRQLATMARELRSDLPVLFVTGHAQGTGAHEDLGPGMQVMNKPFTIDALANRIRDIMP